VDFFFKSLNYLYELVRTNFSADFWTFRNFDSNFANIVASSSDKNENYEALLKGRSLLKKMLKTASKSIHKPRRNDRSNYTPRRTHSPPDWSMTDKKRS